MRGQVLPRHANTHTESSGTGLQTTRLREDARRLIRDAVGGTDDDVVIFCGSGVTAAVNKLVGILELRLPAGLADRYRLLDRIPREQRPVVFIGPYEHHSNELPWRESIADLVVIDEDADGHIDPAGLRRALARYADRPLRIGSFSAASNVTGTLTDADRIAALLHRHGALSFWDYAAAGPYVPIRMSESRPGADDHKDAIFLSPHKFVGGPQTPGVLVAAGPGAQPASSEAAVCRRHGRGRRCGQPVSRSRRAMRAAALSSSGSILECRNRPSPAAASSAASPAASAPAVVVLRRWLSRTMPVSASRYWRISSAICRRNTGSRSACSIASIPTPTMTGSAASLPVNHPSISDTRSGSVPLSPARSASGNACANVYSAASVSSSCLPRKW